MAVDREFVDIVSGPCVWTFACAWGPQRLHDSPMRPHGVPMGPLGTPRGPMGVPWAPMEVLTSTHINLRCAALRDDVRCMMTSAV